MKSRVRRSRVSSVFALVGCSMLVAGCGVMGLLGPAMGGFFGFGFDGDFGPFDMFQDELTIGERFGGFARLADDLLMTAEQRRQAGDIDDRLADDIKAIRDAAQEQFRALLTPEQQTLLDDLGREFPEIRRLDFLTPSQTNGFGFFGPLGFFGRFNDISVETVETRLGLSAEQRNTLDDIRAQLPEDIKARQEAADEEFRAILDPGQLELLDDLLDRPGFFPFPFSHR